jgi:hypothetical protein
MLIYTGELSLNLPVYIHVTQKNELSADIWVSSRSRTRRHADRCASILPGSL